MCHFLAHNIFFCQCLLKHSAEIVPLSSQQPYVCIHLDCLKRKLRLTETSNLPKVTQFLGGKSVTEIQIYLMVKHHNLSMILPLPPPQQNQLICLIFIHTCILHNFIYVPHGIHKINNYFLHALYLQIPWWFKSSCCICKMTKLKVIQLSVIAVRESITTISNTSDIFTLMA
jgi:hypothetical protein